MFVASMWWTISREAAARCCLASASESLRQGLNLPTAVHKTAVDGELCESRINSHRITRAGAAIESDWTLAVDLSPQI